MKKNLLVYVQQKGHGWASIDHMAKIAARCLGAEFLEIDDIDSVSVSCIVAGFFARETVRYDSCIIVCPSPSDMRAVHLLRRSGLRADLTVAWVIDSFWTEYIRKSVTALKVFDHVFLTCFDDLPAWRKKTGLPCSYLPWGADVLGMGSAASPREIDLLRVGRQPAIWDDDEASRQACEAAGLVFSGRPPFEADRDRAQSSLVDYLKRSKHLLAYSNIACPSSYTHPVRQYLTGRWMDGLAAGCVIAGIPPVSPAIDEILWRDAILELPLDSRAKGIEMLREAVSDWSAEIPVRNYRMSLQKLDWRWRFDVLAKTLGMIAPVLATELDQVASKLSLSSTNPEQPFCA